MLLISVCNAGEKKTFVFYFTEKEIKIDGNLNEWNLNNPGEIILDDEEELFRGKVWGMWDDNYIYLAFKVKDNSPFVNSTSDPVTAYKYGDTVEFFISTNLSTGLKREKPIDGDFRIIFFPFKGKNYIFAYRPEVKNIEKPQFILQSPVYKTEIDWCGEVKEGFFQTRFIDKETYILEAKIPLKFLNLKIEKGKETIGDFALNFSDPSGEINVAKVYWQSGGAIVTDIPLEAKIFPDRWGIIEFK